MDYSVSIIIPVYNEEKGIVPLIKGVKALYPDYELIVVDDGSRDATAEQAEAAGARVIHHPYNMGNGAAVRTGIRNATGDVVVMMDGDGQHNPQDIERLVGVLASSNYDMVIGARNNSTFSSFHRNLANRVYNAFATYITGIRIQDATSGFRAAKRKIISRFLYLFPNGFSYPVTSTLSFIKCGYCVKFVPIQAFTRVGKSKLHIFRDGTRFFLILFKIATLYSPLKIFFPISMATFLAGFGYYIYMFIAERILPKMSMLVLLIAVMIFLIGLISEQVSQLRYERSEIDS